MPLPYYGNGITSVSDSIAHFNHITHLYDRYPVLDQVDFLLPKKGVIGLLGLNGAGKTTTMNLLCGVLAPSEGQILIDGSSMKVAPKRCKAQIGYAPDRPPLYPDCTVTEYLLYVAAQRGIGKSDRAAAIDKVMQATDISHYAHKLCGHLSHGYRQRLNLAQAIVHSPPLIVLDEPTSGLDPAQIESVRKLIRGLSEHSCVLISTHLLFEVQQLCNRVLIVHLGRIIDDYDLSEENTDTHRYLLRFGRDADSDGAGSDAVSAQDELAVLQKCPVITDIRSEGEDAFNVRLSKHRSARKELLAFIVENDLDLLALSEARADLEKRFLSLTSATPAPLNDGEAAVKDAEDAEDAEDANESDTPAKDTHNNQSIDSQPSDSTNKQESL